MCKAEVNKVENYRFNNKYLFLYTDNNNNSKLKV